MGQERKKQKQSLLGRCERCGKMIVLTKFTLCYECRREEKQEVDRALEYLKDHRGATLNQIAQATGVNPNLVLKLIRGGRVETKDRDKQDLPRRRKAD